jgi:hypothetical protein
VNLVGCLSKTKLDLLFRGLEDGRLAYASSVCSMHPCANAVFCLLHVSRKYVYSEKIMDMSELMWLRSARSLLYISALSVRSKLRYGL